MRFIILGGARTGSNFLIALLRTHHNVRILGELFNLNSLGTRDRTDALSDPVKYLERQLFVKDRSEIKATGFKIFYYHATKEQLYPGNYPDKNIVYAHENLRNRIQGFHEYVHNKFNVEELGRKLEGVWEYLRDDSELKVIHLKRRNKLETLLSLRRAFVTDKWKKDTSMKGRALNLMKGISQINRGTKEWENSGGAQSFVYLSYEDCLESFHRNMTWEREYDYFFQNHDTMELFYEDLCSNIDSEMGKIHTFLEIPHNTIERTSLEKQSRQLLSESISNYSELKQQFENTQWHKFFTE